jgi:hypothetical protein
MVRKYAPKLRPTTYNPRELLANIALLPVAQDKREEVSKANPFHYSFGNVRPIWKTYQTYAQNMGLIEPTYD